MRNLVFLFCISAFTCLGQTRFTVSSQEEFNIAHTGATEGDVILWSSGTYQDIFMNINKNGITVTAENPGAVIFNGTSKVEIHGDHVTLSELQFIGGNIGTDHVIRVWGDDVLITQLNISDYTSYKYLIVDEDSQRATISNSNFENRLNLDDQNILSILVDENVSGYHKIQYCSFKNFEGTGNDMGIEPIRIGLSTQAHLNSRTIVEYCYFTNCDGDDELISNKASQNVIRYNTFEKNLKAELVLRHGDEAIVYGNFFIDNMGGIRVREGSNHFIYNNYFERSERRSIYLQNESSDPLSDIHIYYNTIVNSAEVILGGDGGSNPPQRVTFANNIFASPTELLFEEATGNEMWIGNISDGNLGIDRPNGVREEDPQLFLNSNGFYQITGSSPAIDNAESGFPDIFSIQGLDFDNELSLDLMKQSRPNSTLLKDVGAVEFTNSLDVKPHVTEANTGPSYLNNPANISVDIVELAGGKIILTPSSELYFSGSTIEAVAVPDDGYQFKKWLLDLDGNENPNEFIVSEDMVIAAEFISDIVLGIDEYNSIEVYPNPSSDFLMIKSTRLDYHITKIEVISSNGKAVLRDSLVKNNKVDNPHYIDLSSLNTGIYLIKIYFESDNELSPKVIRILKN